MRAIAVYFSHRKESSEYQPLMIGRDTVGFIRAEHLGDVPDINTAAKRIQARPTEVPLNVVGVIDPQALQH